MFCRATSMETCLAMLCAWSLQSALHSHQTPFLTIFLSKGLCIQCAHMWEGPHIESDHRSSIPCVCGETSGESRLYASSVGVHVGLWPLDNIELNKLVERVRGLVPWFWSGHRSGSNNRKISSWALATGRSRGDPSQSLKRPWGLVDSYWWGPKTESATPETHLYGGALYTNNYSGAADFRDSCVQVPTKGETWGPGTDTG